MRLKQGKEQDLNMLQEEIEQLQNAHLMELDKQEKKQGVTLEKIKRQHQAELNDIENRHYDQ